MLRSGAPEGIRTPGLLIRRRTQTVHHVVWRSNIVLSAVRNRPSRAVSHRAVVTNPLQELAPIRGCRPSPSTLRSDPVWPHGRPSTFTHVVTASAAPVATLAPRSRWPRRSAETPLRALHPPRSPLPTPSEGHPDHPGSSRFLPRQARSRRPVTAADGSTPPRPAARGVAADLPV